MKSSKIISEVKSNIGKAQYAGFYGIVLESADRNTLTDVEGNQYIDFLAGASAATVGYAHQDVIDAYADTAKKLAHSCFVYSPNIETVELAKKIIEITPGEFSKKVLFGLSASDSIDGAIKAARKFSGKMGVISFKSAYHGNTGLSAQATGFPGIKNGFLSGDDFYFSHFPSTDAEARETIVDLKKLIASNNIACFITEPILGDGGNIVPPMGFYQEIHKILKKNNIVFIDDETQGGMARTGKWWSIEHFGVQPDLLVAGKGLSGGYAPVSICVGRSEIINSLTKAQHVFTYSGHPPSSAVVSKVINIIENDNLMKKVEENSNYMIFRLNQMAEKFYQHIKIKPTGIGWQLGLPLIDKNNHPIAALIAFRCTEKGIYFGYFGKNNEVLRIHPPLTISKLEIDKAIIALSEAIQEWTEDKIPKRTISRYKTHCLGLGQN